MSSLIISCKDNRQKRDEMVKDKIESFHQNQTEWDSLAQKILRDDFVISHSGKNIKPEELNKPISDELQRKGIVSFSISNNEFCSEVEFVTNWTSYPIGTLYLNWTPCDSIQTKKGYYNDNTNFIEVWGIGNSWLIWVDSDFI